ncbi:glyoxalase [Paenibacillus sp. IHB B 3415]|uniref:VOC family protein n=1 Tax=Paenibacillus sp. IHB B 3415 TaxID=867080 RepID=UPI000575D99D|nr:VOC family protein [Paenibacillus sp. IHB B 3415]KHL91909.1 glyoxalase [Paenibacillus sp. IHB B 3415]
MITSFDGINLYSKDPAALAAFYSGVLGVPIPFEGYGQYDGAKIGFDRSQPGIIIWDESKWEKLTTGAVNLVFSCSSLDETYEQLKGKGLDCQPPVTMEYGGKEMNFRDPDGNGITLLEGGY